MSSFQAYHVYVFGRKETRKQEVSREEPAGDLSNFDYLKSF